VRGKFSGTGAPTPLSLYLFPGLQGILSGKENAKCDILECLWRERKRDIASFPQRRNSISNRPQDKYTTKRNKRIYIQEITSHS
jgi:hypothetical protein